MKQSTLRTICRAARSLSIPVIYTRSVGFYASFSLQLPSSFPIVETHPDPGSTQDLRLTSPWPELVAAAEDINNLTELDDHQHGHVPYLLLLLHYLNIWKAEHNGQYPANYKEKTEFREMVRRGARTNNPEGGEENFDEAVSAVLKSVNPWRLSSNLREVFEMSECQQPDKSSDTFWIIASAVKTFYDTHGILPLPGSLPDMKAQSADYIKLQNIYKSKARQDLKEVETTVRTIEDKLKAGSQYSPIASKEIETFCKNAAHIKLIRGRDIPELQSNSPDTIRTIRQNIDNAESVIPVFIALQALDHAVTEYREVPSSRSSINYLEDSDNWSRIISKLLSYVQHTDETGLSQETRSRVFKVAKELLRAGGGELHNIAALTGGLVAQEALKVLTRQYVPLDNTFVFNGIESKGEMFRF